MRLRRTRTGLPAEVAAAVPGRALAWAATESGWLVGTRDALVDIDAEGAATPVAWEQIQAADWEQDEDTLTVSEVGVFGEQRPIRVYRMAEPGLLLELVRERVTASVVLQRWVGLGGRRGLHVIARRAPRGGELAWYFEYGPRTDPDDPEVRAAARAALTAARQEVGGL